MCEFLPRTEEELRAINGMGKVRVKKYGEKIIEAINKYCSENNITPKEAILEKRKPKKKSPPKGTTQKISLDLFKSGLSVEEIAQKRDFVVNTIESHLSQFILTGELPITDVIPKEKYLAIKGIMEKTEFESLSDLKSKIGDQFSYGEMRMVLKDIEFRGERE